MPPVDLSEILERAQETASSVLAAEAESVDREGRWPEKGLRALQAAGLGGLVVPEEHGGLGHGLHALARVCEVLGRYCGSTAMCFGMHSVGAAVLAAKATPDQQARYLVPIARGRHLTTLALSEPGTGSHFYLPQTRLAAESPGTFRVTGTKAFVTNGGMADSYVVSTVAAEPEAPPGKFSCIVVDGDTPGLSWGPAWNGSGMRGNSSRRLDFKGVTVPRRNLLGEEGDQIWYVFHVIAPYFLTAMAGTYLGIASAAFEEARAHLARRTLAHSGRRLSGEPVLQHRLGTLWAELERTRRLVYHAAAEADAGAPDALVAILSSKAEAADCVVSVTNAAMTLMGGIAYEQGARMDRHLRDARAAPVMAPTTDMLRTWTGRALLNEPLISE